MQGYRQVLKTSKHTEYDRRKAETSPRKREINGVKSGRVGYPYVQQYSSSQHSDVCLQGFVCCGVCFGGSTAASAEHRVGGGWRGGGWGGGGGQRHVKTPPPPKKNKQPKIRERQTRKVSGSWQKQSSSYGGETGRWRLWCRGARGGAAVGVEGLKVTIQRVVMTAGDAGWC